MLSGTEHGISKPNIVLRANQELDFSLRMKRERMHAGVGRGYRVIGRIETIYIEPDRDCSLDPEFARGVGRRLYWPEGGPYLAKSIPEEDLIFASNLPTRNGEVLMPMIPDQNDVQKNPWKVDIHGQSHLGKGEGPIEARKIRQSLYKIASAKFCNFLVFQPIAQIIVTMLGANGMPTFGTIGTARMPISSQTGYDGRKLALMIDPRTGEAFFTGGRYALHHESEVSTEGQ